MRSAALLLASLFAAASAACASTSEPVPACASNAPCAAKTSVTSAEPQPPVAKIWAARCGSCHVRVEPGTRDRGTLETALKRHRVRVKMDEAQWASLVDFLAARPDAP